MHGYLILTRDVRMNEQLTVYYGDSADLDRHREKAGYTVSKSACQDQDGENGNQDVWARDRTITVTDMHKALEPWMAKCAAKDEHRITNARNRAQASRALRKPGPWPTRQPTIHEAMNMTAKNITNRDQADDEPRTPTTPDNNDSPESSDWSIVDHSGAEIWDTGAASDNSDAPEYFIDRDRHIRTPTPTPSPQRRRSLISR